MCGIVGIFQKKSIDEKILVRMTKILSHRGPDDEGIFVDKNIGLGHRRLSIIDLSKAGHQPMFNEDKTIAVVYNGEIYNFQEIKKELEGKKHHFRSNSDTEVIIHAYEQWGEKCVNYFNGMWAFIIYDSNKKTFFISRDRLGVKPFYYYYDEKVFLGASEIKALLKYPGVEARINPAALNEYFTFQNILSSQTLFKDIHLLEAGHNLIINSDGIKNSTYWDADFQKKDFSRSVWQEKITHAIKESVWRQLVSDVPVGSLLSGGMDSGTISYFASQKISRMMTFTGGFDLQGAGGPEAHLDERREAEMMAKSIYSEHYENVLHSGSMAMVMPRLIWHLEDLRLGMSYPQYYIAKLASAFVKVAISGTGGDELFGGYPWRYKLIKNVQNKEKFNQIYYNYWSRLIKDNEKESFFSDKVLGQIDLRQPHQEYLRTIEPVKGEHPLDKALYFEQKTFLHGFYIVEDKLFMAHSLELRVPLTDFELIKLANAMPAHFKVRGDQGKIIFRQAMKKFLPKAITTKKKTGFTPPEGSWYRNESSEYVKSILLSNRSLERGYFKPKFIERIIFEHIQGHKDHRLLIWSLLSFEWWNRIFLEGEGKVYEPKT